MKKLRINIECITSIKPLPLLSTISVSSRCLSIAAFFWISPWYAALEIFFVFCLIRSVSGSSATYKTRKYCSINLSLTFWSWLLFFVKFSHLCQFAFCLLKIRMVLHIRLNLCVLCDTLRFRCLSYCGSFCFWNMPEIKPRNVMTSDTN